MKDLIQKKKAVLRKLYGGKRKPYMHKFSLINGKCDYCRTFLGDKNLVMICRVITPDEVRHFRII